MYCRKAMIFHPLILLFVFAALTPGIANAQARLLFDGDFESGTFQGWTPGGENGGFSSVAAKGSCYSGNDTTAISFNGNDTSNYAALLRSNAAGSTDSIATLRSQPFSAGNGVLFSSLSETLDPSPGHRSVNLVVKIINSSGEVISEQPYLTAVVQLAQGCPSEKRDAAFSSNYIDTHHLIGQEISIEFNQNTKHQGLGYFTLLDNVLYIPEGQFLLSTSQPTAVAGTGVTDSGTFFLDPRASVDPDNGPVELNYRWFIDGEESVREIDVPCVNLNEDFRLSPGNNIATLYVNDGFHYAADTIRFVIPEEAQSTGNTSDNGNTDSSNGNTATDTANADANTNTGESDTNADTDDADTNADGATTTTDNSGFTLTDPLNECDVNLDEIIVEQPDDGNENENENGNDPGTDPGTGGDSAPTINLNGGSAIPSIDFSISADTAVVIAPNVTITDNDNDILSTTISIANPADGDSLNLGSVNGLQIVGSGVSSITISQADTSAPVPASIFASAISEITFLYQVPVGDVANESTRTISYSASDDMSTSRQERSEVNVIP